MGLDAKASLLGQLRGTAEHTRLPVDFDMSAMLVRRDSFHVAC
jgi:hypothetical protein